ncbi:hypothetical protein [Bacillus sp. NMTD17]|nr:hypothetical protein [Bacillus sp. NMTD17]
MTEITDLLDDFKMKKINIIRISRESRSWLTFLCFPMFGAGAVHLSTFT